ncbi:sensor histidine kinase [Ornithinibacillus halophilus]|uniref:sensor histidine kinase n=1 Tax=Ornithinibacillus halophilus TaxID=930117 RepID=UPI001F3A17B6|nr:HAMP domain-containing sensor histidine kinase [Ornithinibacillus halophilus]
MKIVITFISVVIISIIISYFVTPFSFHREDLFKEEIVKVSNGFADLIEITGPEKIPDLLDTLTDDHFELSIANENGVYFETKKLSFDITNEDAKNVLESHEPVLFTDKTDASNRLVGVPIEISNQRYALMVQINYQDEYDELQHGILISLIVVLFVGSLLFVLASRYLVNPIRNLTDAARKVATGNFDVHVENKTKNMDEVGELISSFNHMASELEKIDKMRDDFVSNVSHEIQSPLTSVKGFTKALRDDVIPEDNRKEYLDIIYQEIERLSRLSDNLLRIASLDSEHHPYHPISYRLDEQLRNTVLTTEPLWKDKNIDIQLQLEPVEIYADEDLMEQVWLNLITNAIRYNQQNGQIQISIQIEESEIQVVVKDTGIGIPSEAVPNLFSRFYKVDRSRNRSVDGNGLGLSIVKKILTIHKFDVKVDSNEGEGSTFTIKIPIHHGD